MKPLVEYIDGRHTADERQMMVALPAGAPRTARTSKAGGLPLVHILVPADFRDLRDGPTRAFSYTWNNIEAGLDGIAIDLPPLKLTPTHGGLVPLNIQVKDPLWPLRNMLDVSVSVRPGEARTVWLDLRDRILPNGRGLYLTIAAAAPDFGPSALEGADLRLVFKPLAQAKVEHVLDRFTEVRDNYAQIVEERPNTRRLNLYTRFENDLTDLLRVDPTHTLGRQYWFDYNKEQPRPPVALEAVPAGVPAWAFRQVQQLHALAAFVNWYIDNRQVENGEFGGGLSDDGDLTNTWPGAALMGIAPAKLTKSLLREMDAFYDQGMFTSGLSTIQTDELHSYEEGISVLGQALVLDYGSPKQIERAMETARAVERLTGVNAAGHRHIRSTYFSGTKVAEDSVWGGSKANSYLVTHPALSLVDFNGSPATRKWSSNWRTACSRTAKADALGRFSTRATIHFASDRDTRNPLTAPSLCSGPRSAGRATASTSSPSSTRGRGASSRSPGTRSIRPGCEPTGGPRSWPLRSRWRGQPSATSPGRSPATRRTSRTSTRARPRLRPCASTSTPRAASGSTV